MTLPASFKDYQTAMQMLRNKRLMIGTDGLSDSGKTEFALSIPGPGIALCLDRAIDGVLQNPTPPAARNRDWVFDVVAVPLASSSTQAVYLEYWKKFYERFKLACANPDAKVVLLDGDSDSWELQRLAEFGKLTQILPIHYSTVNSARRAMIARAWDSKKIIIATNKIKREYEDTFTEDGTAILDNSGKNVREWKGKMERQGFRDQDYLWQIQLHHMFRPESSVMIKGKAVTLPKQWGIRINKCKANMDLIGQELWGDDCNFQGLVSLVFPQIPLEEWGFK